MEISQPLHDHSGSHLDFHLIKGYTILDTVPSVFRNARATAAQALVIASVMSRASQHDSNEMQAILVGRTASMVHACMYVVRRRQIENNKITNELRSKIEDTRSVS
jgi:hypothetical protein